MKNYDLEELKKLYFKDLIYIDDPIDEYSLHALIHDAVVMDRKELFDFLLF